MWATLLKWLGAELIKQIIAKLSEWSKVKNEERKKIKELKSKIKVLKKANTPDDLRAAIRDINI